MKPDYTADDLKKFFGMNDAEEKELTEQQKVGLALLKIAEQYGKKI